LISDLRFEIGDEKYLLSPALSSTKDVEEREQARQRAAAFFPLPATQERGEGQGEGRAEKPPTSNIQHPMF
jgi:hypothetical protein